MILNYKKTQDKIGFTCSTFDLLHAGHVLMLAEAKSVCDYLIVGIQTDPTINRPNEKNKPIQSILERQITVSANKFVDHYIVYDTEEELCNLLRILPINIRILGEEYQDKDFTGKDICEERGIEIYYNTRKHNYSTSSLRRRVKNADVL
jgi:glycerol-3-phosphate cytidylyltransferase